MRSWAAASRTTVAMAVAALETSLANSRDSSLGVASSMAPLLVDTPVVAQETSSDSWLVVC
jgi:hypothetical protein